MMHDHRHLLVFVLLFVSLAGWVLLMSIGTDKDGVETSSAVVWQRQAQRKMLNDMSELRIVGGSRPRLGKYPYFVHGTISVRR